MCDLSGDATASADGSGQTACSTDQTREATLATVEGRAREIERREVERAIRALEQSGDLEEAEANAVRELATGLVDGLLEPVAETLDHPAHDHEIQTALELFGE